ncbi:MAG: glycosyltransferase family 2 protein [Pseudomonadota bacterium]
MKTVAVLVTYHPDTDRVKAMMTALEPQVDGLILVDNGSDQTGMLDSMLGHLSIPCEALFQPDNRGLAQAQNAGIALAQGMGAAAVLLMDQDSLPGDNMVAALKSALTARQEGRPAAIGAAFIEPARGTAAALPDGDYPEVRAVIASGTLIPIAVFHDVGRFDEALFIDFVDTEWCLRARARGYRCFIARNARMTHQIGERSLRFLGRRRAIHAPERLYYQVRNGLLLARYRHVPRLWLAGVLTRTLLRSCGLALLTPPRRRRFQAVWAGFVHGLQGRSGPAESRGQET